MALDPNIIFKANDFARIDPGQLLEQRAQLQIRNASIAKAQRDDQLAQAKVVRLGQVGSMAAGGDYDGAKAAALSQGDFDLADHVSKLDDASKAQLHEKVTVAAPVFAAALAEPDPTKRTAIIAAAVPTLQRYGYTPDEIAKIQPTNEFLAGAVANAQTVDQVIKGQQDARDYGLKREELDYRKTHDAAQLGVTERGNYLSAGLIPPGAPGGTVIGGAGGAAGGGNVERLINSDAGGGYVPSSVKTLGQFVDFGKSLNAQGAKSSSAGTYQINGTTMREFGPKALGPGWQNAPFNADTQEAVGKAIFDWAKQQSNPAAALKGRWVSLSSSEAKQLVNGSWEQARGVIAVNETGGGAGASAAGGRGGLAIIPGGKLDKGSDDLTPDALERAAIVYGTTGQMPTGLGRQGVTQKAILNKWADIASKGGTTPEQQVSNWQDYKTHQQGLKAFATGPEARTTRSLNVTIDHLDTLQNAAQALQNGNVGIFNRVRQSWNKATGSPIPTNFEGVRQIVSAEVAKAITGGNTALADRQDLIHSIGTANSPQQLAGYIAEVKKLMAGQLDGLSSQYKAATGRDDFASRLSPRTRRALGVDDQPRQSGTLSANVPTMTPEQARNAPKGTRFRTTDGRVMVRQ